ncbi:MAG: hypothetical protein WKF42_06440 [Solirubrobacteraceae bacterium]
MRKMHRTRLDAVSRRGRLLGVAAMKQAGVPEARDEHAQRGEHEQHERDGVRAGGGEQAARIR